MTDQLLTTDVPKRVPNPGKGGARLGSGRKPQPRNPTLLQRAYELLDDATIPAVKAVALLIKSRNPMVRLHAAKVILSKTVPDKIRVNGASGDTHYHYTVNVQANEDELARGILAAVRSRAVASAN